MNAMVNLTNSITTLLFDWDGTVVDSAQLGLTAFKKSFALLGIEFHQPTYEKTYSPNWYSMYEAMGIPKEKWDTADELWMKHYGEQTATLVEGAKETLFDLQRKGYRLGVVSSGSDCRVGREIKQLGLASIFDLVICNEHMVRKKPHPEGSGNCHAAIKCLSSPLLLCWGQSGRYPNGKKRKRFDCGGAQCLPHELEGNER